MVKSYRMNIRGLDSKMEEGIPEKHTVMVTGTPGTMKSSICYNFLYHNAKDEGVNGLFLTLEQDKDNFMFQLKKLGMGEPIEGKLNLYDMTTTREQWERMSKDAAGGGGQISTKNMDLETFKRQIETLKGVLNFELLVIDSLPVLEMMFKMDNPREDLFHFLKWLKTLGVTTLLISEMSQDSPKYSAHDIDFLVDGIIKVGLVPLDLTTTVRHIQVIKMRGVHHSTSPMALNFKNGEFEGIPVII